MNLHRGTLAMMAAAILSCAWTFGAGTAICGPLNGRHVLTVRGGLSSHERIESSVGAGGVESHVNGFGGSLGYAFGTAPEWTFGVSVGALGTDVLSSVAPGAITSRVASVVPILFEARWYPDALAMGPTARPFLGIGVGPYVGVATNSVVGESVTATSVSETVPGGRALVGVDWAIGSWFLVGVGGGYHIVGEFDQPIGNARDYSGVELLFELGIVPGGVR